MTQQKTKYWRCPNCGWTGPSWQLDCHDHSDEYLCPVCMRVFDDQEWYSFYENTD